MTGSEYKYDVAFSFLKEDEDLATQLNDLIQERLSTFLYSRRQTELAGTDGEKAFNDVFGKHARVVVVLYRKGWGQTPWTRIEETAIRNRAFDEGYDFVTFVPLDGTGVPQWLPRPRIWVGLERWGIPAAAAVIEARVQEAGGASRVESVEEKAARLKRAMDKEEARRRFLSSEAGVAAARNEAEKLYEIFSEKAEAITKHASFELNVQRAHGGLDLCASHGCLAVDWVAQYSNTLDQSKLRVRLWNAKPPRPGRMHFEQPRVLRENTYEFDRSADGNVGWREEGEEQIRSSDQLAELWLDILMEDTHQRSRGHLP